MRQPQWTVQCIDTWCPRGAWLDSGLGNGQSIASKRLLSRSYWCTPTVRHQRWASACCKCSDSESLTLPQTATNPSPAPPSWRMLQASERSPQRLVTPSHRSLEDACKCPLLAEGAGNGAAAGVLVSYIHLSPGISGFCCCAGRHWHLLDVPVTLQSWRKSPN